MPTCPVLARSANLSHSDGTPSWIQPCRRPRARQSGSIPLKIPAAGVAQSCGAAWPALCPHAAGLYVRASASNYQPRDSIVPVRHRGPILSSHDVVPEIFKLLRRCGPLATMTMKIEMIKYSNNTLLVYREGQVTNALATLKRQGLAENDKGIWQLTVAGDSHPHITAEAARQMSSRNGNSSSGVVHLR